MKASFGISFCFSLLFLYGAGSIGEVLAQSFQEKHVQAVFVFNFTQFVEWPSEIFPAETNAFVIGVLGSDPIRDQIEKVVENETAQNRPLVVKSYRRVQDIGTCHILFISRSEWPNIDAVLSALKGRSILTVSDAAGFANRGGIIQFRTERNRVRLTVNLEAARAARVNISSKLLRFVDVVPKPNSP